MPLGISGLLVMQDDVKRASSIVRDWSDPTSVNARLVKDTGVQIPPWVIEKCYGVCFLFYLKAGFIWSGGAGSGFVVTKLNKGTPQQRWSAPSAVTAGGMGWGLQIGAEKVSHVVFLNNKLSVQTFCSQAKANFGADIGVALGPVGRQGSVRAEAGNKGVAATYSYSYTQGAFAGLNLDGTVVGVNPEMNKRFYGYEASAAQLLNGEKGMDAWKQYPELARMYMMLDHCLSREGSQAYDGNYGESSLSSFHGLSTGGSGSVGGNWWDSPSVSRQGSNVNASAAAGAAGTAPNRSKSTNNIDPSAVGASSSVPQRSATDRNLSSSQQSFNSSRYGQQQQQQPPGSQSASYRNDYYGQGQGGAGYYNDYYGYSPYDQRQGSSGYAVPPPAGNAPPSSGQGQDFGNPSGGGGYWEDYFRRYGQPTESFDRRYREVNDQDPPRYN